MARNAWAVAAALIAPAVPDGLGGLGGHPDVRTGHFPVAAERGNNGGDAVHQTEVPYPVGVVGERDGQLGMHHGVVPGAEAALGARQVAQAHAGAAQRDTGAQPRRRGGKVGDRPGQVLGPDPDHAPQHQGVGVLPRHLGGGGGQERQPGQALRLPAHQQKGRSPARPGPGGARRPGRRRLAAARSPHSIASRIRPAVRHNTASREAAAAPTDASAAGSWACHASSRRASAAPAWPARKSSVPSNQLRRAPARPPPRGRQGSPPRPPRRR